MEKQELVVPFGMLFEEPADAIAWPYQANL